MKNQSFSCEGIVLTILQGNHGGFSRDFFRLGLFESKIAKKAAERANIENKILLPSLIEKLVSLFPFNLHRIAKGTIIENIQVRKKKLI